MNILEILNKRGFIENKTHQKKLEDYINQGPAVCYIGFDPTASSLHVGSLVPIMALAHFQRCGNQPIALVGGGTGLIGDPSGKTEIRKLLTKKKIKENSAGLKKQLSKFIDFTDDKALLLNNEEWLTDLKYIDFLRDIGRHFSINRMIKAESYKSRLDSEDGLNFIEFNYMLLQSYDFLKLFESHNCKIQMGGSDQWGNIVAGIELIRRMRQKNSFGITFPLLVTSNGKKMGKTESGTVWLDASRTSPYQYYQFWINTDDRDIKRFMALFTFLPMEEIEKIEGCADSQLNEAKAVLAYETTKIAHGKEEADKAFFAASGIFGEKIIPKSFFPSSGIPRETKEISDSLPTSLINKETFQKGLPVFKLFCVAGLTKSGGEAKRLIKQGGAYIDGNRITDIQYIATTADIENNSLLLRAGKKRYHKIIIGPHSG
jgi:tyrosyl-tRNA synthetase